MRNQFYLFFLIVLMACTPSPKKEQEQEISEEPAIEEPSLHLEPVWSSDTTLRTPESVIYDKDRDQLFVSNINFEPWGKDGNGFISKMDLDGQVTKLKWITGLNAPKGMGIFGTTLYVADIDKLVEIDIVKGKITNRYGTTVDNPNLNDVTIAEDGTVYVSGSAVDMIFKLDGKQLSLWHEGVIGSANGVLIESQRMLVLGFDSQSLYSIDPESKKMELLANGLGSADGIERTAEGGYIISSWAGEIFYVGPDLSLLNLLDTRSDKIGAADIAYIADKNLLLVPTFYDNRIMAYRLVQ